jgi:type IV pilus assembly protein PilM
VGDASQVEQIVAFEAAQNVPYPIDQVVWDWQLLDEGKGGQMEVILAAIKADLLDEINDAVQSANLRTGVVEIAPMALYNALRYNYADADGCTLLVDIGSRTTNLLFCEPGKIFPRRLNIGGSTITTAIAKDLGIAFTEADKRKVDDGFVSLGGSYAEHDDAEIARISKIIRNQMTRLHQEIARSITFYRSEHGGSQPVRVLLSGGTASLPYMREFFQEKFPSMDVEYFNPLRNVSVADSLDVEQVGRDAHMLGELVGLALRGAVSCPMELNLHPASVTKADRIAAQRPFLIAAGVCVLACLAGWWQYFEHAADTTVEVTERIKSQSAPLADEEKKIKKALEEIEDIKKSVKPLLKAVEEREYWVKIINDINQRLPQDYVWVTSFELPKHEEREAPTVPTKSKEAPPVIFTVQGLYLSKDAGNIERTKIVDQFLKNIADSAYVEAPKDESKIIRGSDDTAHWAFPYSFPLKLKNPIDLK